MSIRRKIAEIHVPWAAIAVAVSAGALSYALVRMALKSSVHAGDSCSIDVYRRVLASRTTSDRIERAWYYMPYVQDYASRFGVDWTLLAALIQTESGWNPKAGSGAGAVGLTQFVLSTAKSIQKRLSDRGQWPFGALDRTDPQQAIWMGAAHLGDLLRKYDLKTALAVYNAGPKVVGMQPSQWPSQTKNYVPGVIGRQLWFQDLREAC